MASNKQTPGVVSKDFKKKPAAKTGSAAPPAVKDFYAERKTIFEKR